MRQYNNSNSLYHYGILGQKWGIRRFQNKDGTLTAVGRKRYKERVAAQRAYSEEKLNRRYLRKKSLMIPSHPLFSITVSALAEKRLLKALREYGQSYEIIYDDETDRYWLSPRQ